MGHIPSNQPETNTLSFLLSLLLSPPGAYGLSSACDRDHPEDCARCNLNNAVLDPTTNPGNVRRGTCECVGGAPRCGLCTQRVTYPDDRPDVKGYFRLNNECQECPDNPELILIGILVVVVMGSIAAWWLQKKKINISIMTIGFDYFQILAIFARIDVNWPSWVKDVLEVLSIFNFNIGKTWCFVVVLLWRVLGGSSDLV